MNIFIDESGDLGMEQSGSPYFVLAAIITQDHLRIRRCFKRIRNGKLKKSYKELPEFKYNKSDETIKRRILKCVADSDIDIAFVVLKKDLAYDLNGQNPNDIYRNLSIQLITEITNHYFERDTILISIDKSMSCQQRDVFDGFVLDHIIGNGTHPFCSIEKIEIEHVDSRNEPLIQAVDFVAGAVHQRYRNSNGRDYDIINNRIIITKEIPEE